MRVRLLSVVAVTYATVLVFGVMHPVAQGGKPLDVYFIEPDDPQGQVRLARVGPESVPRNLEAGDNVDLHYMLGVVTSITRR